MGKDAEMAVIIRAKDMATKSLSRMQRTLTVFGNRARSSFALARSAVFSFRNALMAIATGYVVRSFIQASNQEEIAISKFHQSLISIGRYTPEFEQQLLDLADALQKTTTASNEHVLEGTALLSTYKQISNDVMPRAMSVMTDIAALMGGDMRQAANMLGKAAMGLTGELRRTGITVERTTFENEGFLGVLREIEEQVKGQAAALRNTNYGGLAAFSNAVVDVKERFGDMIKDVLGPWAEQLSFKLMEVSDRLKEFMKTEDWKKYLDDIRAKILSTIKSIGMGIGEFVDITTPAIRAIWKEIKFLWDGFKKLPSWVQSVGIVAAILGGKKGAVVALSLLHLVTVFKNQVRGFQEVWEGNIKFSEFKWMNAQKLAEKLEELDKKKETLKDLPPLPDPTTFKGKVKAFIDELEKLLTVDVKIDTETPEDIGGAQAIERNTLAWRERLKKYQDDMNYYVQEKLGERIVEHAKTAKDEIDIYKFAIQEKKRLEGEWTQFWGTKQKERKDSFVTGWRDGLKKYVDDNKSMHGLAVDTARNAAQAMQSAFQTFFFDMFSGEIRNMKDLMRSFLLFVQQVAANVMAHIATIKIMSFIPTGIPGGSKPSSTSTISPAPIPTGPTILSKAAPSKSTSPQNIIVNVNNAPAGTQADVSTRRDHEDYIIDIILRNIRQNGALRGALVNG